MLLSKRQLLAHKFCSTDETRPSLNGIQVEPTGRVLATDGHCAVIVPPCDADSSQFPQKGEASPEYVPSASFILPTAAAVSALKSIPRGRMIGTLPILAHVAVVNVNGTVDMQTTDLDTVNNLSARPIDGTFPILENVWPKGEPTLTVHFDLDLIVQVCAALSEMAPDKNSAAATFRFHKADSAVEIERDGIRALIMPVSSPNSGEASY